METAVSGEDKLSLKSAFVFFSHRGQTMTSAQQTCTDSPESAGRPKDQLIVLKTADDQIVQLLAI